MLFELENFNNLIEFTFEIDSWICKKIIYKNKKLDSEILFTHPKHNSLSFKYFGNIWNRLGHCQVVTIDRYPTIVWQRMGLYNVYTSLIYPQIFKGQVINWDVWNFHDCPTQYVGLHKNYLHFYRPDKSVLFQLFPKPKFIDSTEQLIPPELISHFLRGRMIHPDHNNWIMKYYQGRNTFEASLGVIDVNKIQFSIGRVECLSLYEKKEVYTVKGDYKVPVDLIEYKGFEKSLGHWYGDYYIIGYRNLKILAPWNINRVRYYNSHVRDIIKTILLCIKRKRTNRYVPMVIWKDIIIPNVLFNQKPDHTYKKPKSCWVMVLFIILCLLYINLLTI